jgi:starch-binding outer membrane protein, SusD/RagB family
MKSRYLIIKIVALTGFVLTAISCQDNLDEPALNRTFSEGTDYTVSENMILPLTGMYAYIFNNTSAEEGGSRGWEDFPMISVRGDDVNAGGLGDQQDFTEEDKYNYNRAYWMFNSVWQNLYAGVIQSHTAIDEITLYKENGANPALADQYIAEIKTLRAFLLLQLARVWGDILLPESSKPEDLAALPLSTKDEVLQHIATQMDEAVPLLPALRPNERTDVPGGVTRFTALAMKALANLELKNYQGVADATSEIIASNKFTLYPDFYNLFKIPGELSDENLFELQYSDFGQPTGLNRSYLWEFFGPTDWTPAVAGAGSGWGFYEPSLKWIKFMLDRGETLRLQSSVLFTDRGIDTIKLDPNYANLPSWISSTTPSGDKVNNYPRALFASGKHYLPSNQLTPGRATYGTSKNMTIIRYAEILLMHAEAITRGATSSAMTADEAVNLVRTRAQLTPVTGVTAEQVMDEKFAELAMEWGIRYYDMIRLGEYDELSYDGRTFTEDKAYLPYPQAQVDKIPALKDK